MELATSFEYLLKTMDCDTAAKALSNAGITLINFTPRTEEEQAQAAQAFEKYGLRVYQTHAIFNRYDGMDAEDHKKTVMLNLCSTHVLGAKYMVVHGDEFDFGNIPYTKEAALDYNYEYFAPVVEKAEKLGIKIAFENVFEDMPEKPRFCSEAEDLIRLIARFHTPTVCACWDTGHAAVSFQENHITALENVGKRIECTHIHDNNFDRDKHLDPFDGKIDWKTCMAALREKTNVKVLCFEPVYGEVPVTRADAYCERIRKIGDTLLRL